MSLIVGGCSQSLATKSDSSKSATTQTSESKKNWTIGMSQCNLGEPWRVQMNADIKTAADRHPDLKVVFKDAQNDTLRQRAQIEEFVSAGVDLLIVSPKEAQPLTEPIARAFQAGIPVIVLDRAVLGDDYTCFIGADNVQIGRAAGTWIADHIAADAKIVELKGLMTSVPAQDRHNGFIEGLGGKGKIVFDADMKWLEPEARKEMDSALSRFDDIKVVYAHNDPGAHGAYLAAKAAGREKDILFIGIDALPQEGVAYVDQGLLNATFQYPTGGLEAISTVREILAGEKVPKKITLKSKVFTKDNVKQGGKVLP
ncbi:MAG TPA: substrate-binding domain-containing protein [Lacipirellulaceae bacterium]|nr:substrate-binding domain-containing protein [Lacipirellulaceae bacterium]